MLFAFLEAAGCSARLGLTCDFVLSCMSARETRGGLRPDRFPFSLSGYRNLVQMNLYSRWCSVTCPLRTGAFIFSALSCRTSGSSGVVLDLWEDSWIKIEAVNSGSSVLWCRRQLHWCGLMDVSGLFILLLLCQCLSYSALKLLKY